MTVSFWISLILWVVSGFDLFSDHREAVKQIRDTKDPSEADRLKFELNKKWFAFIGTLVLVLVTGWESISSEKALQNVDPRNLSVTEVSLTVVVDIEGKPDGIPQEAATADSWAELFETNTTNRTMHLGKFSALMISNVRQFYHYDETPGNTNGGPSHYGYTMEFRVNPLNPFGETGFVIRDRMPLTVKDILEQINMMQIHLGFVPKESQIIGGSAELNVNGTFNKQFRIPRQKTDKNMSEWNPNRGMFLYVTNAVP